MNKTTKFFIKFFCGIILCLATTGCAQRQSTTTSVAAKPTEKTALSEVIAVETVSDQVPANVSLGDNWCYFRFNLTKEELEEIYDTLKDHPTEEIALSLPGCTPDDDAFYINITPTDVKESIRLLDKYPEQQSVNLIKELPIDALADFEKPEPNLHFVYYLLTEDDIMRMLDGLQTFGGNTVYLKQRLDINSDNIAEFELSYDLLDQCLQLLHMSKQPYLVYICQVEAPETI